MVDFAVSKVRHRMFGFKDKNTAQAWEMEARAALMRGLPLPPGPLELAPVLAKPKGVTIMDHFREVRPLQWRGCKAADKQARTAELFIEWVGKDTPVSQALTGENINAYVSALQAKGISGSTINRRLAGVSVLLKHALNLSRIDKRPLLPTQKANAGRIRWFTRKETEAIFRTLEDWGEGKWKEYFQFLLDTGCRPGEAVRLSWQDFASDFSKVTFYETKNGVVRTLPLTGRVKAFLSESGGGKGPFAWVTAHSLRTLWERLRAHYAWLGDDAVVYSFRHTCASWLVQNGVDLLKVKTWMGHTSLTTTMIYSHLAPKHLEDMAGVLEGVT